MNEQTIRWGIIGTGRIARAFAEGLKFTNNGKLHGIASRSLASAQSFAQEWDIPSAFGNYQELAESCAIDAVYIATPHSSHAENAILCMKNKKAVLCEKPFAVNSSEVEAMIKTSREMNVLLMEGMWSRFPPLMNQLRDWLNEGKLGDIRTLHADFGFLPKERDPNGRLFNLELAGGSLLDLGIYPVSLASMIMGKPTDIQTLANIGPTGVDEQAGWIFSYSNGALAMLLSSLECETRQEAFIAGSIGNVRVHKQCWKPQKMTFTETNGEASETIEMPFVGNGFNYEAESFGDLLIQGKKESPIMPLDESLTIMNQMDQIRKEWNLVYPMDKE